MDEDSSASIWFEPERPQASRREVPREFARIWQGFMTARFTLATLLLVLQVALYSVGALHSKWQGLVSLLYLTGAFCTGLFRTPRMLGATFNQTWLELVGLDLAAFAALQLLHGVNINYAPLFTLPVLLASVIGSRALALGTAAGVSMLLLGSAYWSDLSADATASLVPAALSGVGYFAMALLGNHLATRLLTAGDYARRNRAAARVQQQVNSLVIESLPDGVMIVDADGLVRAANPAACEMLTGNSSAAAALTDLKASSTWGPLLDLARQSLRSGAAQEVDTSISFEGNGPRRILVRSRPTVLQEANSEKLCVLFLQDQRELEARVRTEKLASMGRMSTAVAHEIRNPLAAIAQANALLDEDISDPRLKQLTRMVSDNTLRLSRIVDDILNVSRVQPHTGTLSPSLALNAVTQHICGEWTRQNQCELRLLTRLFTPGMQVRFNAEHLRRVLVNLLDNAKRFASDRLGAIQVLTEQTTEGDARLCVWSDGVAMDANVQRHLFEPFLSSGSRSSGLGLYICRELCQGHNAQIAYRRSARSIDGQTTDGNEFQITFETDHKPTPAAVQAARA